MVQRKAIRWTMHNFSSYTSVTDMQNQLYLRSIEQRRAETRLIMLYKIIHGIVAIPLPSYFQQPLRMTRHRHPLAFTQIHTSNDYYKYSFFPLSVVQWNRLPADVLVLPTLEQFGVTVRSLDHSIYLSIYLSLLSQSISDHHLRCGGWLNLEFSKREKHSGWAIKTIYKK